MNIKKMALPASAKRRYGVKACIKKQATLIKSSMNLDEREYRNALLNFTLRFYLVAFLITVPISLLKTFDLGMQPINYLHICLLGIIVLLNVFKTELTYKSKVNTLISIFYTVGVAANISMGLSNGNYLYFAICILLAATFMSIKCVFKVLLVIIISQLTFMTLTFFDIISYSVSPLIQFNNIHFWSTHLTAFITIIASPLIALGWLNSSLKNAKDKLKASNKALEMAKKRLIHLSHTDELTHLPNRRALFSHAKFAFKKYERNKVSFSVLMIDIDYFKKVNDTYGHDAGDSVLRTVANVLRAQLRDYELVARSGGEEFVAVLQEKNLTISAKVAERIRVAIENSHTEYQDTVIKITASIGVSQVNANDTCFDDAMKRADKNLYQAKNVGRNRVIYSQ